MKKSILTGLFGLFIMITLIGQDENKYTQIGFNMSPLVSQVIPFTNSSNQKGPYTVLYRRFNQKNEKGFEFGIGMDIALENEINFVTMRFGYISKKQINDKISTVGNFDFAIFGGGFNEPGDTSDEDAGVGFIFGRSIEYEIFKNASIGTEILAFFGLSLIEEGPIFRVIPPIAIFFNVRL